MPTPARMTSTQKINRLVRHFRCSIANTASMIGMVTSAVRETMTKAMLTIKPTAMAISNSACQILFVPQQT